ncbi:hypothetical protein PHYPSEUDO_006018 [Phytophthora pseudosyringae]|uniref:Uncharacterized protein n=1 Tax=Phytophthora pseudosyringae TaxID=221518 RepID=A0A8T1VMV9_9STRA|nr:hypothetical protein PHYPSEUDO_006018 [Phytophthora pseudosyringae]
MLTWATFAALLLPLVGAQSVSDETSQSSGLLGLASLLPAARYGTPHLSQLIGARFSFVNPFINGWFIGAYNGMMQGRPVETRWDVITASISGAEIDITNPFLQDILTSFIERTQDGGPRAQGLSWSIAKVNVSNLTLPRYARAVSLLFTALLFAVPIAASGLLDNYSGIGSVVYVAFGVAMRALENTTHVSVSPRPARNGNPMGLIRVSVPGVVLLHTNDGAPNVEDMIHPRMEVRSRHYAALCTFTYRVFAGVLLLSWLGFLVAASEEYTNGYIELATMAVSALSEVVMQRLVIAAVHVQPVRKCNAITTVAWLAHRRLLDTAGVPPALLHLRDAEIELVHALYANEDTGKLWGNVPRCNPDQVNFDGDGPAIEPRNPADLA